MIARARQLWSERSPREQVLLGILAALLALVLLIIGGLQLSAEKASAAARYDSATREAGQVAAAAEALRLARRDPPPALTGTLALAVSQSADAAGFALGALDPQPDGSVSIQIPAAKGPALFAWIATLAKQGVFVERIALRANSDATLGVEATLKAAKRS